MTTEPQTALALDDIQTGALRERPSPYVGRYLLLRLNDPAEGRELVRRLHALLVAQKQAEDPEPAAWVTVAFTYAGLVALGVAQTTLDSFPDEFRQGMAARAHDLGDVGASAPDRWEWPLGTDAVHVAVAVLAPDEERLTGVTERARARFADLPTVEVVWRQDCYQLATGRTSFGFKDGIGNPDVQGSGLPVRNSAERAIRAGEFILGYPDETGSLPPMPQPAVLGVNGTYLVFRKLRTDVAAYRRYLRERARDREEERLLAAKMVGRWPSGAPLAMTPHADDPQLGADPSRNNSYGYREDLRGFKCPAGAHARRANPRDALEDEGSVDVRLHRMIRRGTSYGPALPDGVLEDDGVDRGIVFVFVGTHLGRQYEFVKTQWINDGVFIGTPDERDPLVSGAQAPTDFTIPHVPIRRRLRDIPPLVVTRGGEYCFAPGLRALQWLGDLGTLRPEEDQ